jgi:hypothetical protein
VTGRVSGADEVDDANVKVEAEADAADSADLTPELGALGDEVITASPVVDDRVVSEWLVGFEVCTLRRNGILKLRSALIEIDP